MPIYAYRCEACGFAKDVLQKVSDAPLTVCLSCSAPSFKKQVTAAGFQLKGTGWYVTDFRGGAGTSAPAVGTGATDANTESKPSGGDAAPAATATPAPASNAAAGTAPANGSGGDTKSAA